MKRAFHKREHVIAITLALSFFIIGLLLGTILDTERAQKVEEVGRLQKIEYDSLQLQYIYLDSALASSTNCEAAEEAMDESINNLIDLSKKIDKYIEDQNIISDNAEFMLLKREYLLSQLRYWALANKINEVCNTDNVPVLYFYNSEVCTECVDQGYVLTSLKKDLDDKLLNFNVDLVFTADEPMARILKGAYDINRVPSIVIDGITYPGYMSKEDVLEVICPMYREKPEICKA